MVYNGNPRNVAESQKISNKKKSDSNSQEEHLKRVFNQELTTSVKEFSVNELTNMTTNKENETALNSSRRY